MGEKMKPINKEAPTEPKFLLFIPYKQQAPTGVL